MGRRAMAFAGLWLAWVCLLAATARAGAQAAGPSPKAAGAPARKTGNVVFVTIDGFRWQEVFGGFDPEVLEKGGRPRDPQRTRREYWRDTPEDRRAVARVCSVPFPADPDLPPAAMQAAVNAYAHHQLAIIRRALRSISWTRSPLSSSRMPARRAGSIRSVSMGWQRR